MTRSRLLSTVALLALLATPFAAKAADTVRWGQIGGWKIMVDRTVGDGCFAYQAYDDGSVVRIGLDMAGDRLYLIYSNVGWQPAEEGKVFRLRFIFDGLTSYNGDLRVQMMGSATALVHDGLSAAFIDDFAKRNTLQITLNGKQIARLSLRNTYAAMGAIARCQNEVSGATPTPPKPQSFES